MTPDERTLLSNFLQDLAQARTGPKDAEAETMINQALVRNPDAAYLLVQHTILSDQALNAAQARIAELEGRGGYGGSFFGGGQPQQPQPQTSVPPTGGGWAQQPQPQSSPFSMGGGLGGFLRQAGTMAAGVAAGDMLFSGLSGLFGGHHGYGGGFGGGGWGQPTENVTINEYNDYGDDGGSNDDWSDNS